MLSVDVFLTTYNSEKTIRKTLDSIFSSDYGNFNLIVSDDCSIDSTLDILNEYQIKYVNMKILTALKNQGILQNCNKIIDNLNKSDIVMFCGHDDIFYKNKISKCVEAFINDKKLALVYHDVHVVYSNGRKIKFSQTQKPREKSAKDYLLYGTFSTASSVCVKSIFLQNVRFKKEANRSSDYLMMYEVSKKGRIKYINEILGEYHRHDSNLSSMIKKEEDFDSISTAIYVLNNYPEDTFEAFIALNVAIVKLLFKRKKYLPFYFISPVYSSFWHLINKLGKKII